MSSSLPPEDSPPSSSSTPPWSPQRPHPVATVLAERTLWPYLLVGLAQGLALWLLQKAFDHKVWPATHPSWLGASCYLAIALPFAWYLGDDAPGASRRRVRVALGLGALYALLGAHAGNALGVPPSWQPDFGHLLAALVLGFVAIALSSGFVAGTWRPSYPRLFEHAWRNALLLPIAGLLTAVLWVLMWAGAWLMQSIGLSGMRRVLTEPPFMLIVTCAAFGLAAGAVLGRADTLPTARRFWLAMNTWFLPLALGFAVVWLVALAIMGVTPLFATRNAAFYLFWFCALCIVFANAAFQDGHERPSLPAPIAAACTWAWLAVPLLALLGDWALWQRVDQHGWTADRIWAAVVGLLVTLHGFGYALSAWRRLGWFATLPATNIVVALVEISVVLALISPWADSRKIAVQSQVARLLDGRVPLDRFDWRYLRSEQPYGLLEITRLSKLEGDGPSRAIAQKAADELLIEGAGPFKQDPLAVRRAWSQVEVLPAGVQPEQALIDWLSRSDADWTERTCRNTPKQCLLWLVDLNGDGGREALLLVETGPQVQATIYAARPEGWRRQGHLQGKPQALAAWRTAIEANEVKTVQSPWPDLQVNGQLLRISP